MTEARVYKYRIPIEDEFTIEMPRKAEIILVAAQTEDDACIWARVMPDQPSETRRFRLRGTGHAIDMGSVHVGSCLMLGGRVVFHLFEVVS